MNAQSIALQALAWLLTYALHSTLLLGAAWFVTTYLVRSERTCETLWKLALLGGVATASVQRVFALEPHTGTIALAGIESPAERERGLPERALLELGSQERLVERTSGTNSPALGAPQGGAMLAQASELGRAPSHTRLEPWTRWLAFGWKQGLLALWIAGGLVLACLFSLAAAHLRDRLTGRTRIVCGALVERLAILRTRAGLRRPVRLMLSPRLRAPIALGTLLPEICLPPRALAELTEEEQEALLAHELAHIARFDPTWLTICRWMETLFFFQPFNRLARARLDHAAELLCDEQAVRWTENRLGLARCLAAVAEWIVAEPRRLLACGMAGRRSRLAERVTRILEERTEPNATAWWVAPASGLALAATVLLAPGFASPRRASEQRADALPADLSPLAAVPDSSPALPEASSSEPDPRAAIAEVRSALEIEFDNLQADLAFLRHEIALHRDVPEQVTARLRTIETRLAGLREKKRHIDELATAYFALDSTNTTIDVMDRSQQGGNQ